MSEDNNLVDKVKGMYLSKEYEVVEDNTLFIIKDVIYSINEDFLRDLYK